ncbi:hypothetical protein D4764_14G0004890 [Takifugu flavidus]|uniref:CCHC-type domain-containing protein n=1 Tax=Takifugu flavidus TaxID=433684 RepID=A0A5C6P5U0_9TELE|nr:hypothetical protein D4764_14G0004890 [Takifugu flavidus]
MILRAEEFKFRFIATSSALKCFNCNEEGHLSRACPSRVVPDAPRGPFRRRGVGGSAEGGPAVPDGVVTELEERRGECVSDTEVSGGSESVEMVVEMNGEAGGKVDLTGVVCDLSGGMSDAVCDSNEQGKNGEVMGKKSNWVRQERLGT